MHFQNIWQHQETTQETYVYYEPDARDTCLMIYVHNQFQNICQRQETSDYAFRFGDGRALAYSTRCSFVERRPPQSRRESIVLGFAVIHRTLDLGWKILRHSIARVSVVQALR